jgi:alkylation response protein AidB-like acyl-CoA dehydrogenase
MPDHQYLDVFLKEEDRMARDMFRGFVEKEIMPVRQQIDDDKEHEIVNKILQGMTNLGLQKRLFPRNTGAAAAHRWFPRP